MPLNTVWSLGRKAPESAGNDVLTPDEASRNKVPCVCLALDEDIVEVLGLVDQKILHDTLEAIASRDAGQCIEVVDHVYQYGYDVQHFCRELLQSLRNLILIKVDNDWGGYSFCLRVVTPDGKTFAALNFGTNNIALIGSKYVFNTTKFDSGNNLFTGISLVNVARRRPCDDHCHDRLRDHRLLRQEHRPQRAPDPAFADR
jgi:hypothetical protein